MQHCEERYSILWLGLGLGLVQFVESGLGLGSELGLGLV